MLDRALRLSGRRIVEVARELAWSIPGDPRRSKGWTGALLEAALGAHAASRPGPDFPRLGIELKTIPVDHLGRPRESTFICSLDLSRGHLAPWARCEVRAKLSRVLWIPIERRLPAEGGSRIGIPHMWSPSPDDNLVLQDDWEALGELWAEGLIDRITARMGAILQMRPKAASSRQLRWAVLPEGERVRTMPRGIYLRARFTRKILHGI